MRYVLRRTQHVLHIMGRLAVASVCIGAAWIFISVTGQAGHTKTLPLANSIIPSATITSTHALHLPLISSPSSRVLIAAAHIDSAISGEPDEAILLWNVGGAPQALAGWQFVTKSRRATFPISSTLELEPGARLWCTAQASAFRQSFGLDPGCEWAEDTDPAVSNLSGRIQLTNAGGWLQLVNESGETIDTLVYGSETGIVSGWQGAAAQLYARGAIAASGQVWQRKRSSVTGWPIDSDSAIDWAGDVADLAWGRHVRFPGWQGWDDEGMAQPVLSAASASATVAIGPEGLYQSVVDALATAQSTIDLNIYTFEHPQIAHVLVAALQRGVRVRLLVEGAPPGGIDDIQRWCLAQVAAAGGDVRYMAARDDAPRGYRVRYSFNHAKYGIIDGLRAFVGTENFNWDSMPVGGGESSDQPQGGRRGVYLFTDAAPVVTTLTRIFADDWRPDLFLDLRPFALNHDKYGGPPADFVFPEPPTWDTTSSPFHRPLTVQGVAHFGIISVPENAMRPDTGLMALIARAGSGDEIMLTQLYEHKFWGDSTSNPIADPNPRLQALMAAARRGAQVRLLLDEFFDDSEALRSNRATVAYVRAVAAAERLNLEARLGNPTRGGIHAKVVLIRLGDENWTAVGSLNGSEFSHKVNREIVLLTDMAGVYTRLSEVFSWDWVQSGP